MIILARGGGSIEELWAFNEEILADAIHMSNIPVVSAVGHETDFTISDFTSDFRAPTPSAAAELCLPETGAISETLESYEKYMKINMLNRFSMMQNVLDENSPSRMNKKLFWRIENKKKDIQYLFASMNSSLEHSLTRLEEEAAATFESLNRANPDSILRKGYAIVYNESEKVVSGIDDVNLNESITIAVKNGKIKSKVTSLNKGI